MSPFAAALLRVAVVLVALGAIGAALVRPLFPRERAWKWERAGWGFCAGLAVAAAAFLLALATRLPVGAAAALVAVVALAASRFARPPRDAAACSAEPTRGPTDLRVVASALLALGVAFYAVRAMTEPMWSNDFIAIWGLKGKTLYFARRSSVPLFTDPAYGFSHPEYPLGLPLVYAGLAALSGGWDDHALALLFPALQGATLAVLFGWLRRRGASLNCALAAVALLSLFEPLYSGFLTGMAEVPLSCALLLLGTAWSDAWDAHDDGALRRVGLASLLAGVTKNEGLFAAAAAGAFALLLRPSGGWRGRARLAAASVVPAAIVAVAHRAAFGPLPLRDFDFHLLFGAGAAELPARLGETARAAFREVARPAVAGILGFTALAAAGRRTPAADRLLLLAATSVAAYLALPVFAVQGPEWLVQTTLARTAAALAPLTAGGIALRLGALARRA